MWRWSMSKVTVLIVLLLPGLALAQAELPPVVLDPRSWFTDVAALAAVVFGITALAKERFDLHGIVTLLVSYGAGILIAVGFSFTSLFDASLVDAVVYGAAAATLASGGRTGIMALVGKATTVRAEAKALAVTDSSLPPSRKG